MCPIGGLQAIAELIQADHEVHGNTSDQFCVTVRRYAGMALTNLTFGDGTNKALLCSMKPFMQALVAQLHSPSEDLRQVHYFMHYIFFFLYLLVYIFFRLMFSLFIIYLFCIIIDYYSIASMRMRSKP